MAGDSLILSMFLSCMNACLKRMAFLALVVFVVLPLEAEEVRRPALDPTPVLSSQSDKVPGVVVAYEPSSQGRYIGSPSLAVLPTGEYVASHDFFGPKSRERIQGITRVYGSVDQGQSWQLRSEVKGAFWSVLFVHRGDLYLLGVDRNASKDKIRKFMTKLGWNSEALPNHIVIRRSTDGGRTWTQPNDENTGLLFTGRHGFAPTPVLEYEGNLWRALGVGLMTASADADLLRAASWRLIPSPPVDKKWLDGKRESWGEGTAIVAPDGRVATFSKVRYLVPGDDRAALLFFNKKKDKMEFDPATGFVRTPGARIKFTVRFDPVSKLYWAFTNYQPPEYYWFRGDLCRNTVAMISSPDLREWTVRRIILQHDQPEIYGFQYWEWDFEGNDVIALSRTAWPSPDGGPPRQHDANYMTFHRIGNFRDYFKPKN